MNQFKLQMQVGDGEHRLHRFDQNIVLMRHGERMDNFDESWVSTAKRPWDPPLIEAGKTRSLCKARQLQASLGFPIHRVFTSPFMRCAQTAAVVVSALCSASDDDDPTITSSNGISIDSSKCKVSVELGLSEMLNNVAVRNPPKDGNYDFNISQIEKMFPDGTVDNSVKVYKEPPEWGETKAAARARHLNAIQTLADRFPLENLLLIVHGEGLRVALSAFTADTTLYKYKLEYCAHLNLRRSVVFDENELFTADEFHQQGQAGVTHRPLDTNGTNLVPY